MLPNFAIVGAQKSGTTTLHHILARHPDVFFPAEPQEIHFFDLDENFERGLAWYESLFEASGCERWVGQTSPLYMYEPIAIERLSQALPDFRAIAILRNPVDRAYSHYWHEVRYGWESKSFEQAIEHEPGRLLRLDGVGRRRFSYCDRGFYASQVERLFTVFGRDRVLVTFNEELAREPDALLAKVATFLDVDSSKFPKPRTTDRRNSAMRPRSRRLQRLRPHIEKIYPLACGALDRINLISERYPPMKMETRKSLERKFAPENARLARLLGIDPSRLWR